MYRSGRINDQELSQKLEEWLEELEDIYESIESLGQTPEGEQASQSLEDCNELLNSLYDALETGDREAVVRLSTPLPAQLQETFTLVTELRATMLPPAVEQLFSELDLLLAGQVELRQVLLKIHELEENSRSFKDVLQGGSEEKMRLLALAENQIEEGLRALRQGAASLDASQIRAGKELLTAANATLVGLGF